jgi:hypothetical protein
MKRVFRVQGEGKVNDIGLRGLTEYPAVNDLNPRVTVIQALIPLGLHTVGDLLQDEVARPHRGAARAGVVECPGGVGSVYLQDQKLPLPVPRVRDRRRNQEVPLEPYQRPRVPRGKGDVVAV